MGAGQGSAFDPNVRVKRVQGLGRRASAGIDFPEADDSSEVGSQLADDDYYMGDVRDSHVLCPEGHFMYAKVARELLEFVRPSNLIYSTVCDGCETEITKKDAVYTCSECDIDYCMNCTNLIMHPPKAMDKCDIGRLLLSGALSTRDQRPPMEILPGDILFCGPDPVGVHHVILCVGPMKRFTDAELIKVMEVPPDFEVYTCETVESNLTHHSGEQGDSDFSYWYHTNAYFSRDKNLGDCFLIGDWPAPDKTLELAETPVRIKVMTHPMRAEFGESFDQAAWDEAVEEGLSTATSYGAFTALRGGVMANHAELMGHNWATPEKREQLLEKLQTRWASKDICASVAVKVWQMYFIHVGEKLGEEGEDWALKQILRFVPLYSDSVTPSELIKVLTMHDWVLHGNFDD